MTIADRFYAHGHGCWGCRP